MRRIAHSFNRFLSDVIRALTGQDPRRGVNIALFLIIIVLLPENLANLYQTWIENGVVSIRQFMLGIGLPLIVAGAAWLLVQRAERMVGGISDSTTITPHRGLIWLISPNPRAIEIAVGTIGHHQPLLTDVWVIGTFDYAGVTEAYQTLQQEVSERGWEVTWHKVPIKELTIKEGHDAVTLCYGDMPGHFVYNDMVADITGGNKLLSTGVFIACVANGWSMSYVDTPRDREGNPDGPPRYIALDVKFVRGIRLEDDDQE